MTLFQWFSLISIFIVSLLGGLYPLLQRTKAQADELFFDKGKAFTSGVFLALSLSVMLPNAFDIWHHIFDHKHYPLATYIAISVFICLLAIEHRLDHIKHENEPNSIIIPLLMTLMIGICSFLLGTALGVSDTLAALMIFFAIIAHKGSASFALALTMVRSKLTQRGSYICFFVFALSTPAGIIVGSMLNMATSGVFSMIFKATVMSVAAGVFLYLATTYELRHNPFVANCRSSKGFSVMLIGVGVTIAVSVMLSWAHGTQ